VIAFRDVTVRYRGAPEPALSGVTYEAARGNVTALAGPNGSGKSTIVRALLRRVRLESGDIRLDGQPLAAVQRRSFARRVAAVTQREEAPFAQPVREYVALGRYPHEGPWRAATAQDERAVARAIELAGIGALADRSTAELSGGEWQRTRIARALAQGGEALVLDEPTTFLDVAHEMATFELLAMLARDGLAVLVVSHQLNLVARFAHKIVLMHRGRVAAHGPPATVMEARTLEAVYEWPVVVVRDPAVGAPTLVPLRGGRR
jgi:iron complex transport system ATP-binding protein